MQFGLKLGSREINYTKEINSLFKDGYFHYIELFAVLGSFNETIDYWKQFSIPIIIHAPHSLSGMNLSLSEERENNKKKLNETFNFADALNSEYIIFNAGINGKIEETINQLLPFADKRCLIENKPAKGLNGEKCLGTTADEIKYIQKELKIGFCLDFGHAICSANTNKINPHEFINGLMLLNPSMYHLSDGIYLNEIDSHLHFGKGTFPLMDFFNLIPEGAKVSNEAAQKNNLNDFITDSLYFMSSRYLRRADISDMENIYEWANDADTRKNSFNQTPIPFDVHKKWFENKINSDSVLFYIYQCGKEKFGQARFDIEGDTATISCTINPLYRGKGYGYKILLLAEDKIIREFKQINNFHAEVKNDNIACLKMMKKLNYDESQEEGYVKLFKKINRHT